MTTVEPGQLDLPAGAPDDYKYLRGRDGWLFLDRDTNRVLAQHTGELQLSEDLLRHWQRVLENRVAWLARRGVPYTFLVAPNAHAVYPEMLPDGIPMSADRPVMQILRRLDDSGSPARILYPRAELVGMRDRPVYPKTGTHWTELGAFIACRAILQEIGRSLPVRQLEMDDVEWVEDTTPGDLGRKVDPIERSVFVYGDVREPRARLVADNRVKRNGRRVEFEGDAGLEHTCLVTGDSFAVRAVPYLAESFRRLVFGHISSLDYSLVEAVRPDVVVTIMNERFLINPPVDLPAPTLAQLEAERLAAGEVLPPRRVDTNRLNAPR
jgi:hypothetical protein